MDRLKQYVNNGKTVQAKMILNICFGIGVLVSIICGCLLPWLFRQSELPGLLAEIPTLTIQQGTIQSPKDTIWEKKVGKDQAIINIDTTRDTPQLQPGNGIFIARQQVAIIFNDSSRYYTLPDEDITIDSALLHKVVKKSLLHMSILIGCLGFLFLLLIYWGTVILTSCILRIIAQSKDKAVIRRAALVGWISISILDTILICLGYGFSVLKGILAATAIALLCLFYPDNN